MVTEGRFGQARSTESEKEVWQNPVLEIESDHKYFNYFVLLGLMRFAAICCLKKRQFCGLFLAFFGSYELQERNRSGIISVFADETH
jgi:hypothetical protein